MDNIEKASNTETTTTHPIKDVGGRQADQAALFLAEAGTEIVLTAAQEKRLKRKIDWILLPMVCCTSCDAVLIQLTYLSSS